MNDFTGIWNEYKKELESFIRKKVDSENDVEDILQEVSIKLSTNITKEIRLKNHRNWLFQVTRNTIADFYRKQNKSQENNFSPISVTAESCVCDLSEFIIKNYLPEPYAKPLFMSDIEQRPQKDIADLMNLSLTATKSRIQRGRIKLKELIEECVDLSFNKAGQIVNYQLKNDCKLPQELVNEIEKLKLEI